jgi:anti-sigma-K factor RskA
VIEHDQARLQLADLLLPDLADPGQASALKAHVAVCPACQAELATLRELDERIRSAGPSPQPSPELSARILALADATVAPAPTLGSRLARTARSLAAWRAASAALAATAVALALVVVSGGSSTTQLAAAQLKPSKAWQHAAGTARLERVDGRRMLRLQASGMHPSRSGLYELWLARTPDDRISLGTFEPDASGRVDVTVPAPDPGGEYRGVWITFEPHDGDPGWSSDWVLAARLA